MRLIAILALASLAACAQQGPRPRAVPQSANPSAVIAAEIAYSRLAQEKGYQAAQRETGAKGAIVFTPQPTLLADRLKVDRSGEKTPKWQPHRAFMSCDGKTGVTTGAWQMADGSTGFFTTVWFWFDKGRPDPNQPMGTMGDGEWKWVMDHGEGLPKPRAAPEFIETKVASCKGKATAPITAPAEGVQMKTMFSRDQSLNWEWQVRPDNSRTVTVRLWNGSGFDEVLSDKVAAPAAK